MKLLFLGDIVGKAGRDIVFDYIEQLQKDYEIDFTIVNGENSAHGKGITKKIYYAFKDCGVDAITMGNHSFSKSEIIDHLDYLDDLIMPYNHIRQLGKGYELYDVCGLRLCVCNILGEALMSEVAKSPYVSMDEILEETKDKKVDLYFVDLHAEATAEKILFSNIYKDKVHTVVGTHTHVQTADERIIGKQAYISDVGMCGAYDSIIGRDTNEMIRSIILHEQTRFTIAEGPAVLSGVVIEYDEDEKCAKSIERIQIRPY